MLWIITEDKITDNTADDPTRVGKTCTRSETRIKAWAAAAPNSPERDALRTAWTAECNYEFRLFDDDGQHYYSGVCLDLERMDGAAAFEPLDWAMAYAGCTTMKYRRKGEKEWKIL